MQKASAEKARHLARRRLEKPVESAKSSQELTAGGICDRHGAALFSLAVALVGDDQRAEAVVVDVICAACVSSPVTSDPADDLRGELVRRLHEHCGGALALQTADRCDRQRYAVALAQQGGLNYREIAELLGISATEAVDWLGAALRTRARA